jgi:threonine dehydrogenase-like Zn-dependent dehydrogenase
VKAALLFGREDARVLEVADPVPGPGEVLVRVAAATTCERDLRVWRRPESPPSPFGFEAAGLRADTGERVRADVPGAFAELVVVREAELRAVPKGLDPAGAAMAGELAAALNAIGRAPAKAIAPDVGVLGRGSLARMIAGLLEAQGRTVAYRQRLADHDVVFATERHGDALRAVAPGGVVVDARAPAPEDVDRAIAMLAGGAFDWRALAAGPIRLDDLQDTFATAADGPPRKWIVTP